jgi:site-specific recombinase XerD
MQRLNADPNGALFVTKDGRAKSQETLTDQIISTIIKRVGIQMTPHQFRHFAATSYLAAHPEDFETVRQALGHAWIKTSLIYGGASSQRSIGAYNRMLFERRETMRLKRGRRLR